MNVLGAPVAEYVHVGRRNNSLTHSGRRLALACIAGVSLAIALALGAAFGAWFVLPFAGLEAALLSFAFRYMDEHAGDYERVEVRGTRVDVEIVEGRAARRLAIEGYWTQVVCDRVEGRVALRSHGREVEIGRHLPPRERIRLAAELKRVLRDSREGRRG